MRKELLSKEELSKKMLSGVKKLADNVGCTLGPKGNNVILQQHGKRPIVTKDGVTIANFLSLTDPFEDAAVQILKQVSAKTNEDAGDGTTTSTVLAASIYEASQKHLSHGLSPIMIKKGMEEACKDVVSYFEEHAQHVDSLEQIEQIATISANGDKTIGKIIQTAVDKVGRDGAISIEDAKSVDTTLDLIEGFVIDSGYVSPQFITNERKMAVQYEDCILFITDHKLSAVEPVLPVLELAARENKPLVIIADDVEGQLLAALIMNTARGSMRVVAVKPPRYGEERRNVLKDLCIATGAKFFTRESGASFQEFTVADFGRAKKVEILKNSTTILSGHSDYEKLEQQIELLKENIKNCDDETDSRVLQERLNRLASGIGVIRVGGATEVEMIEKKHRIEDALEAVRSAQVAGIHVGGGLSFIRAHDSLRKENKKFDSQEEEIGYNVVLTSLLAPFKTLCNNSGLSYDVNLHNIRESNNELGCNFLTGELLDLMENGVIDPVKVSICAITNAVSAASVLMTTSHSIIEVPEGK